ncbi:MAG: hypothetical protein J3K34DRAFT_160516 [Monoraphidium minutum]|nr:MAG: hypothetical protein J3K34DRAFT_160516 [Monoraphidium minutum]
MHRSLLPCALQRPPSTAWGGCGAPNAPLTCRSSTHAARAGAPRRRPRTAAAGSSGGAAPPPAVTVLFDLESVACGLDSVLTACAWCTARAQWPEAVPGRPAAYAPTMRQLLTCIEAPEEAALLIRLCADEGIIGGPGRAGWGGALSSAKAV